MRRNHYAIIRAIATDLTGATTELTVRTRWGRTAKAQVNAHDRAGAAVLAHADLAPELAAKLETTTISTTLPKG